MIIWFSNGLQEEEASTEAVKPMRAVATYGITQHVSPACIKRTYM